MWANCNVRRAGLSKMGTTSNRAETQLVSSVSSLHRHSDGQKATTAGTGHKPMLIITMAASSTLTVVHDPEADATRLHFGISHVGSKAGGWVVVPFLLFVILFWESFWRRPGREMGSRFTCWLVGSNPCVRSSSSSIPWSYSSMAD